jgi:hypothetical protein
MLKQWLLMKCINCLAVFILNPSDKSLNHQLLQLVKLAVKEMEQYFNGELHNDHFDAFLPVEENDTLGVLNIICFYTQFYLKHFL